MARDLLIIGETGRGKTASLRNLDPKETLIISVSKKEPPFSKNDKGEAVKYTPLEVKRKDPKNPKSPVVGVEGNYLMSDNFAQILAVMKLVQEHRPEIKNYIIDDANYIMQNCYLFDPEADNFALFKKLGTQFAKVVRAGKSLPHDKVFIMTGHPEVDTDPEGRRYFKFKTVGKLVDRYLTVEGLFTNVLYSKVRYERGKTPEYYFETQSDGTTTAKTSMGLFPDFEIPNDTQMVIDRLNEYHK